MKKGSFGSSGFFNKPPKGYFDSNYNFCILDDSNFHPLPEESISQSLSSEIPIYESIVPSIPVTPDMPEQKPKSSWKMPSADSVKAGAEASEAVFKAGAKAAVAAAAIGMGIYATKKSSSDAASADIDASARALHLNRQIRDEAHRRFLQAFQRINESPDVTIARMNAAGGPNSYDNYIPAEMERIRQEINRVRQDHQESGCSLS